MPQCGVSQKAPGEILAFEEISRIVKLAIGMGIDKIKIPGGEPLVRKGLPRLLHLISSLAGLKDLSLTTNGMLLARYSKELKAAGLKKLNISIDTLDSQKFAHIARFGKLDNVLAGIDAAGKEKFLIKLNVVMMKGLNDDEILDFVRFAQDRQIIVRFIELMPMAGNSILSEDLYMSGEEIKQRLSTLGNLKRLYAKFGHGPAQYYKIEGTQAIIGLISPMSCKFCFSCNRLRLTADGMLKPCLVSEQGLDLKRPLRFGEEEEVAQLIQQAVFLKPQGHHLDFNSQRQYLMSEIGG